MELRTKQGLQVLRRAHAFLAGKELTAALGDLKPHVEALDASVVRLEAFATEQAARANAARAGTETKREEAKALRREYLRPIAQVARRLFPNDAQLRTAFKLPDSRDDEALIQAANAFAERVEEFKDKFAARGLPVDVAERLRKASTGFRDRLTTRSLDLARRSAATAGMLAELSRGRDLVRLLDLMLAPRLVNHPDQLSEWRTIARFLRTATVAPEKDGTGTTPTVPATPATPATPTTPAAPNGGTPPGAASSGQSAAA